MKRTFHVLRDDGKVKYPEHLIFIDTETTTIKESESSHDPVLILGVAEYIHLSTDCNLVDYRQITFFTVDQLWDFIDSILPETDKLYLFAHNWSFDLPVIDGFNIIESMGFELKAIVDQSPPVIIRYSKEGHKLYILDSLNYFKQSLKSLGESLGIEKIQIDLENNTTEELETYCKGDVLILRESILKLIRYLHDNQLCSLKHTVSSMALSIFTRNFCPCEVFIDANQRRTDVSRASYFGGRTECFRIGEYSQPFYLIDVNSMYPFVMRNNPFPVKTKYHHKRVTIKDLESVLYKYSMTAEVDVKTDIPVFPYKIDGRTCFPVGTFTTFLSTPEIEYGIENNLIENVHQVVLHEQAVIFQQYVDYFYSKRLEYKKENNDVYQKFTKLMLNSLYGKFGQQSHEWEVTTEAPRGLPGKWFNFDMDTKTRVQFMELHGKVYKSVKETESRDSFPAIAAHVTAFGRILMQRMIDYVGNSHVYYCDTDSLLLDQKGFQKVKDKLHPSALGCWSLDGSFNHIVIRGAKDYIMGEKERIKGVRPIHTITKEGKYRQLRFSSLKGLIGKGNLTSPTINYVEKKLTRKYHKANVDHLGVVTPFVLDDGEVVA